MYDYGNCYTYYQVSFVTDVGDICELFVTSVRAMTAATFTAGSVLLILVVIGII